VRLNKYIASSGAGSRRTCDQWIQDGLVIVNGKITTNPAIQIEEGDTVMLRKKVISPRLNQTILINKPRELVCTKQDELERPTIYTLLPPKLQHLNHVGRLDQDSEGLLVLTNDGELAQKLSHPSHDLEKEYHVTVHEAFENEVFDKLLKGVHTPEGRCRAVAVHRLSARRLSITLNTGLKRQIRLMCDAVHLRVTKLQRIRIGNLTDIHLKPLFEPPQRSHKANTLTHRNKNAARAIKAAKKRPSKKGSKSGPPKKQLKRSVQQIVDKLSKKRPPSKRPKK